MKNKILENLTKISMNYVYKIFNVEKVYKDIEDLQNRVETIEDSDIEDRVSDLEDKEILDFESRDFVSNYDYDSQMENFDDKLEETSDNVSDLEDKLELCTQEQAKQRKAIEALCMVLGKKDILEILGDENE